MQLQLSGVSHYYGSRPVLTNLTLSLQEGEIGVLVGPSGSGKSTVLNCIAGLEPVTAGEIRVGGKVVSSTKVNVPVEQRQVGMMFQDCALFPHLSIRDNIAFGLRPGREDIGLRVAELARLCQLADNLDCLPHEVSGGQQQRAALARALAPRHRLLLLDEPFSDSDALLRMRLLQDVQAIIRQERTTMLLVTHDQAEAFSLADRCGVIDAGSVCQWDTAYNLYHRPNCMFVANFIGEGELVAGELLSDTEVKTELGVIKSAVKLTTPLMRKGSAVKMLMRPDDLVMANGNGVPVRVIGKSFRGAEIFYTLETLRGTKLSLALPSREDLPLDAEMSVAIKVEHVVLFPTVA